MRWCATSVLIVIGLTGCSASETGPTPTRTVVVNGSGSGVAGTVFARSTDLVRAKAVGAVVAGTVSSVISTATEDGVIFTTYVVEVDRSTTPVGTMVSIRELGGDVAWTALPKAVQDRLAAKDPSARGATVAYRVPAGALTPQIGDRVVVVLWKERDPAEPGTWTPMMGAGGRFTRSADGRWLRAGVEDRDDRELPGAVVTDLLPEP